MEPHFYSSHGTLSIYEFTNLTFQDKVLLTIRPHFYSSRWHTLTGTPLTFAFFERDLASDGRGAELTKD